MNTIFLFKKGSKNERKIKLKVLENGRYWLKIPMTVTDPNDPSKSMTVNLIRLVEVKNIYREFQIQTRTQEMTRDGSVKFTTEYEALKNGNGTAYQASYGFPWDLHGYNSTDVTKGTLLTGVDYSRMRNDVDADYGTADPISMSNPQYGNPNIQVTFPYAVLNRMEQTGLYAQDQMEWDKWVMTLGGRYDYATTSTLTRATNSLAENHDQQFSWRGGINYLFDNGISPYFSYSESFEPVSGSNSRGQPFDPSRGKQYEAGVKYVPKDMPVVVTAAVYQLTKDKNLTADPANQAFSIQTGEIRSRGLTWPPCGRIIPSTKPR